MKAYEMIKETYDSMSKQVKTGINIAALLAAGVIGGIVSQAIEGDKEFIEGARAMETYLQQYDPDSHKNLYQSEDGLGNIISVLRRDTPAEAGRDFQNSFRVTGL